MSGTTVAEAVSVVRPVLKMVASAPGASWFLMKLAELVIVTDCVGGLKRPNTDTSVPVPTKTMPLATVGTVNFTAEPGCAPWRSLS